MSDPQRFQRVAELFEAARSKEGADREAFLLGACDHDPDLLAEVRRLLTHHDDENEMLDAPVLPESAYAAVHQAESSTAVPESIGPYRIKRQLGAGGMGIVYLAEQHKPRREVAIKVIRPGQMSRELLRRFDLEAAVIGRLQHPGIAQIHEAEMYDDGAGARPYFAMEFVKGLPLLEHVQRQRLSTPATLELFIKICDAVQHAHTRGVIHRDLKPGNILVDEAGQPKILDFGVARATDSDLQVTTLQTNIGQLLGTLAYMSPEQATGRGQEIDTRSDVYALGVLLYEMLADRLPYDLREQSIVNAVNVIANDEPMPLTTVSRAYRGDLNTIVLKALEKEPDRRYQSASDLAADLHRYLNDEAIVARPATTMYQLQKFARRNTGLVGGVSAAFVVLLAGVVVASVFAVGQSRALAESEIQRQVTVALNEFLVDDLLELADPKMHSNREITLRESLDRAVERLEDRFDDAPLIEAGIRKTVGRAYRHLGEFDLAELHLTMAYELYRFELGEADEDALLCRMELGAIMVDLGEFERAFAAYEPLLKEQQSVFGDDHEQTMASLHSLGVSLTGLGRFGEAEEYLDEALKKRLRVLGEDNSHTATTMNSLSVLYQYTERFEESQQILSRALAIHRRVNGEEHPDTILAMANLAAVHYRLRNFEDAAAAFEETLALRRRTVGEEHPDTLQVASSLAVVYGKLGRDEQRETLLRNTLPIQERVLGARHFYTLSTRINLASIPYDRGDFEQAEREYGEVTRALAEAYPDHFLGAIAGIRHGQSLLKLERFEEAATPLLAAHQMFSDQFGPDDSRTRQAVESLIELYDCSGDIEQLEQWRALASTGAGIPD